MFQQFDFLGWVILRWSRDQRNWRGSIGPSAYHCCCLGGWVSELVAFEREVEEIELDDDGTLGVELATTFASTSTSFASTSTTSTLRKIK